MAERKLTEDPRFLALDPALQARYKVMSPEAQARLAKRVFGEETSTPAEALPSDPTGAGRVERLKSTLKEGVKPVERTWLQTLRDLPVKLNYFRPPEQEDRMEVKFGLPSVIEGLPQMLGAIGAGVGSAGGPLGTAGGYGAGTAGGMALRRGLQEFPALTGDPELPSKTNVPAPQGLFETTGDSPFSSLGSDVIGHAMNALPGLGKLAFSPAARDRMRETVIRAAFKNRLSPEAQAALKADYAQATAAGREAMPISLGQVSKNEVMENIYAKREAEALRQKQVEYIKKRGGEIAEGLSPQEATIEARGREGARLTKDFIKDRNIDEARIRGEIELAGAGNTRYFDYDPATKKMVEISKSQFNPKKNITQQQVTAPITLTKSSQYSKGMIDELDELVESVNRNNIPVTGEIAKIRSYLQGFQAPSKKSGVPNVKPFAEIEEARDALDKVLKTAKPGERKTVALEGLRDSLDKDIQSSVKRWGAGSLDKYRELVKSKEYRRELFSKDVRGSLAEAGEKPSEFFKDAASSSEKARRYAISTGVAAEGRTGYSVLNNDNPLARDYVENLMTKHSSKDFFQGKAAFQEFDNDLKQEIPQKFINAETRSNLKHLFEKASIVRPSSEVGAYALEMHKGNLLLRLGRATTQFITMKQFAKRVLVNPKYARIAANLIDAPVESNRAKLLTKAFQVAMQEPELEKSPGSK